MVSDVDAKIVHISKELAKEIHFLEKELKAYNVVDIDNWSNVREYSNISHAFSVKNKIPNRFLANFTDFHEC